MDCNLPDSSVHGILQARISRKEDQENQKEWRDHSQKQQGQLLAPALWDRDLSSQAPWRKDIWAKSYAGFLPSQILQSKRYREPTGQINHMPSDSTK